MQCDFLRFLSKAENIKKLSNCAALRRVMRVMMRVKMMKTTATVNKQKKWEERRHFIGGRSVV